MKLSIQTSVRLLRAPLHVATLLLVPSLLAAAELSSTRGQQLLTELPHKPDAPAWILKDLHGRSHRLSDYRGHWLLVHFWATWCGPCAKELPSLARAQSILGPEVQILAVDVGEHAPTAGAMVKQLDLPFPVLLDEDSRVSGEWQVQGLPTTYIVTADGRIFGGHIGAAAWDEAAMLQWLRQLVAAPAKDLPSQHLNLGANP